MPSLKHVGDLSDWRLCLGCGACAFVCPESRVRLVDAVSEGIRPVVETGNCGSCRLCLEVCPAYDNDHRKLLERPGINKELSQFCGPVLEVWEGHAADPEIRMSGSSGGLITALSLYCLEGGGMDGVLHIGQDLEDPLRNRTYLSKSRQELVKRTGSRYAPASAADSLGLIEEAPSSCVFIGQPSEVTALRKAEALRPRLREKVGLVVSFFCAGSPARQGTLDFLKSKGVDPGHVTDLRYRGRGWPGMFAVTLQGSDAPKPLATYHESWGFVQAYRPFATHLCPDGTGEDADISCGDPWYREVGEGEAGSSLVLVRTERGRQVVRAAIQAGYVELTAAEPWKVIESQRGLWQKRGAIWGRVMMLRMLGLPAPRLRGFALFRSWWRLSLEDKLRSTLGTMRRVLTRGYWRRRRLEAA